MEDGAASSVLAIADHAGVALADTQKDLTPLQRMVITLEAKRQHEEAQQEGGAGGQPRASGSPQVMNSQVQPGGGTKSGDTVTYVNESAN